MIDEQTLIRQLKAGDYKALEPLMALHQDYVYTLAMRMVKKPELAEEVTQDVFVKVYQKIGDFQERAKFSTWLFTIAYRTSLNYLERKQIVLPESSLGSTDEEGQNLEHRFQDETTDDQDILDDLQWNSQLRIIIWQAIDQLDYLQGVIITLFYLNQFSVTEIAEIIPMPQNTIKTHLFRGRKNLKQILLRKYQAEDLL